MSEMRVDTIAGPLSLRDILLTFLCVSLAIPFFAIGFIASPIWTGLYAGWITGEKFGDKLSKRP